MNGQILQLNSQANENVHGSLKLQLKVEHLPNYPHMQEKVDQLPNYQHIQGTTS